jgi:hypothetical protein
MNLVVENLEKKKARGHNDSLSLITHIEQMLNPMGSSPLFKKIDTLKSNHSKQSVAQSRIGKPALSY